MTTTNHIRGFDQKNNYIKEIGFIICKKCLKDMNGKISENKHYIPNQGNRAMLGCTDGR